MLTFRIDDKVPIRQSEALVEAPRSRGLRAEFEVLEGVDHLFEMGEGMYRFIASVL
jgi:dipeptidyl aminopeptidase/acylaminoacyl peptidase